MATAAPYVLARSSVVTAAGLLTMVLGAAYAVLGGQLIRAGTAWAEQAHTDPWAHIATRFGLGPALAIAFGIAYLTLGLLGLAAGCGIVRRRQWGRALGFALAALSLVLGLFWVGGGDGEATDLALGGGQILYGVLAAAVLTRRGAEFSRPTPPPRSTQSAAPVR
jgi:hypothetical protein